MAVILSREAPPAQQRLDSDAEMRAANRSVRFIVVPFSRPPKSMKLGTFVHAELTATWTKADRDIVLEIVSWRALAPGETILLPASTLAIEFADQGAAQLRVEQQLMTD